MRAPGAAGGNAALPRDTRHHRRLGRQLAARVRAPRAFCDELSRQLHKQQQTAGTLSSTHSEQGDFLSSSTKLSAALSRIAIDNSAARNLRNAVTDRLTPYSQRGVQF